MTDRSAERDRMVTDALMGRGINDERVLEAMRRVPREAFLPPELAARAYEDSAVPLDGAVLPQPYLVALMAELATLGPDLRVLELGAGAGYAAAVLAELVGEVRVVARDAGRAMVASGALHRLGYRNVQVRGGDGAQGWPDGAPYDAVLIFAGCREVPEAIRRQVKVGGRIVAPIGPHEAALQLRRIVRTGPDSFRSENFGPVALPAMIGEGEGAPAATVVAGPGAEKVQTIRDSAEPLPAIEEADFAAFIDRFADRRVVLLGEATHGTSEFYRARAQITRRLIERHGFSVVAVEADWPDAAQIDRYVRHRDGPGAAEPAFTRFPTWMWRNAEVQDFAHWLRGWNAGLGEVDRRAGFYGLDLYSLAGSMRAVLDYLDQADPETARVARERYGCLTPWQKDPATYGRAALNRGYAPCEEKVVAMLRDLLGRRLESGAATAADRADALDAVMNAKLVADAERYYRVMYYGSVESWNLRDTHMFETLQAILKARGGAAKAVVWAHNSHIGNAAATEMGERGELNIGQLCREHYGDDAALIGFGTDRGTVAAADDWDGAMRIKQVRPSHRDSYERLMHDTGLPSFFLDLRRGEKPALLQALRARRLERAIGVIYRPETELLSHYFDAALTRQFDGYVWFDETRAVTPLAAPETHIQPETYPFGL
ncbi:MAG TPA: erythromycin esterase family protein [Alphaproteobacteria bacterium]|nr:erythromycin esterase family protein [Alphaproteobacteria bacterium]